jgi:hypothetical protein
MLAIEREKAAGPKIGLRAALVATSRRSCWFDYKLRQRANFQCRVDAQSAPQQLVRGLDVVEGQTVDRRVE